MYVLLLQILHQPQHRFYYSACPNLGNVPLVCEVFLMQLFDSYYKLVHIVPQGAVRTLLKPWKLSSHVISVLFLSFSQNSSANNGFSMAFVSNRSSHLKRVQLYHCFRTYGVGGNRFGPPLNPANHEI